ncbi:DUF3995 domain-containing protein [uncultured Arcticibacterium sp.]|uniref:DUF3995 domain-containing protein n=1 Tax=uncultured Arcticibacterium sp. TaxID=2173042 RepID=UPI0030F71270
MTTVLTILECSILLILGIIHFNWAAGGKFGMEGAVPTTEKGESVLNPGAKDSLIVGLGLTVFALYFAVSGGLISVKLPVWVAKYGGWVISIIFLLRAMGDFNYVGFFKKKRNTKFHKMDTKLYIPLCLTLGLIGLYLTW